MKLPKEIINGFIIFAGIAIYFILMLLLGLGDVFYLRLFNTLFVIYGVNKTLQMNLNEGKKDFVPNAISAFATSIVGVFLSVIGLLIYSYMQGGDQYVQSLSKTFLFGGDPTVSTYCLCLLFEGIASSVIVVFLLMLYYNNRYKAD